MRVQTEQRDPPQATSADVAPLRVLIVDDAASTRTFLRAVLEHCVEFEVVGEADDGDVAIDRAESLQPDLVLLDISMPGVSGAGALKGILEVAPTTMVIIVSGAGQALGQPLIEAGATAFLPKGIAPFELLSRLGSIMGRPVGVGGLDPLIRIYDVNGNSELRRISRDHAVSRGVVLALDPLERHMLGRVIALCDVSVLAETESVVTFRAVIEASRPEVAVVELPADRSMDASILGEVHQASPDTALIAYGEDEGQRQGALAAGATVFVIKPRIDDLVDQIHVLTLKG